MAKIVIKDLHKYYDKVHAVKGMNLCCEDGEFVAFLGPSGCGKSTTMRMIAGLEEISSGEIYLGDTLINYFPPHKRDIAMVFESYALYPHKTVFENIASPLRLRKVPKADIEKAVLKVSEILSLDDVLYERPGNLSDGQKQRVGIGRAIVRKPKAFLFDEPISHLDTVLRQQMRQEIKRLQKELKITMIYVTHDQLEALTMADRIAVMCDGELHQFGTKDEILEKPHDTFVASFVGEPPINLLNSEISEGILKIRSLKEQQNHGKVTVAEELLKRVAEAADDKSKLIVGIRPADVHIDNDSQGEGFDGEVYYFEELDEFNIATVKCGDEVIRVELPGGSKFRIGEKVNVTFNTQKILFFNEESGINCLWD